MARGSWIAVAGLLAGCGAKRACLESAASSGAADASVLSAGDGTCLRSLSWDPPGEEVWGVVVVTHGLRDHATRYDALAQALVARDFAVASYDLRGHGTSGGRRQRFDSLEQLVDDLDRVVDQVRTSHPDAPLFLYGHSLGGTVSARYSLDHADKIDGLVLSGAALKVPHDVTGGQIFAARLFGTLLPNLPAQPIDDTLFVSTPEAEAEFMADSLVSHENLPARSARAFLNGLRGVEGRYGEVSVPILVMHGASDRVTDIEGSRGLARDARSADKTLQLWEGQAHDLLHEPRRDEVIERTVEWVEAHAR